MEEEEEEEEEFIRIHGHCRGTQGARCETDGASLQRDESEGVSSVSAVGLIRLCPPLGRLTAHWVVSLLSKTPPASGTLNCVFKVAQQNSPCERLNGLCHYSARPPASQRLVAVHLSIPPCERHIGLCH